MSEYEFCPCDSDYLKKLLEERDKKEKLPYENLIYAINEYVSELESALILVDSMKMSLKRSRLTGEIGGNNTDSIGNFSLEAKLKELKEERAELYRQQGIQATHLLSLNDQLRSKDTLITAQLVKISELKSEQERKEEEMKKLKEKLKEGEEGAKIIGDELVALQLELLRLDQWQNIPKNNNKDINKDNYNESNASLNIPSKQLKMTSEKEIIAPHQYPISSCSSQPMTRQLLTGSEDQKIILYDLTRISAKMVLKWSKMNGPIVALALDGEGKVAASCSAYDKEVTIWNLINGKILTTLQFCDDSNEIPLLKFGPQFRLWMSLGRSVRLWDIQRGLLLRSWNKELINQNIQMILPDSKRPDRLWCFDEKGTFAVLNAITGKLEVPWKPITNMETSGVLLYDCSMERIVLGRMDDKISWIITGYGRNPSGLDGIFEFNLKSDLKCYDNLRNFAIHPDRTDLLALILDTSVLIVKVSQDNWNPETILLQDCRCDAIQWGPEENDPINGERGCKIVLVDKESKQMKLFTLSSI